MIKKKLALFLCLTYLFTGQIAQATNKITQENKITIDAKNPNGIRKLEKVENNNLDLTPKIIDVEVYGQFDKNAIGVDYYKKINIAIKGENLNASNFLMPEGLHWSDKTYVEIIKGEEKGNINDVASFGKQNTPSVPVKAYSINPGDSGRINYVGKTRSGVDLDLIWTVLESDREDWRRNSGYAKHPRTKGLAFAGEQTIPGAVGNSIVVLYNEANHLSLNYKIVEHGTTKEIPVVLSFITTDIDAAQGVETDLANLVEIIPPESNLKKSDDIIYDTTPGVVGLNGSLDLPKGGYLGAGFLSSFDYTFYSPAPQRAHNSYNYAIAVRYDIFGSSLQANVESQIKQNITVNYTDEEGNKLQETNNYQGLTDGAYEIDILEITGYKAVEYKEEKDKITPVINIIYAKEYKVEISYKDEDGKELQTTKSNIYLKGDILEEEPLEIEGYKVPEKLTTVIKEDIKHSFIYKKEKTKEDIEREQKEKEEREKQEKQAREEKEERERQEQQVREQKEKEEREKQEKQVREQKEKEERERQEKQVREQKEKEEKEKQNQLAREQKEKEEREKQEQQAREQKEKEEREKQEKQAREQKEKEERERLFKKQQEEENRRQQNREIRIAPQRSNTNTPGTIVTRRAEIIQNYRPRVVINEEETM